MNRIRTLLATGTVALTLGLALAPRAEAFVVFDPTNFGQNLLTAANTLRQVNNQILQLQNEATMLINEAKNLNPLNFSVLSDLRDTLAAADQLIGEARGLAFTVTETEHQFANLYPAAYDAVVNGQQMVADARSRWSNSLEALRTAVRVQSQVQQTLRTGETALANLVTRSQSATGALQAAQATNQLLALQIQQGMQAQQLRIADDRAAALEAARGVAATERARQVRTNFMDHATAYVPVPVQVFTP